MSNNPPAPAGKLPVGTDLARRQAAQQCFTRANEVLKSKDFKYAVELLKDACKFAPDQPAYRALLRQAAKLRFDNNGKGSMMASVKTMGSRTSLKAAKAKKDWLRALECCEDCLAENPWDSGILLDEAWVFEQLGWIKLAVWCGESALERNKTDATVNRALAQIYERAGAFTKAIDCWERVKKACPADEEADRKMKDLAASATIDKGGYDGAKSFTTAIADKAKTQELAEESKGGTGEGRINAQIAELEQKVQRQPDLVPPYLQLSQLLRRAGKHERAREILQRGKDATGGNADILTEIAEVEIDAKRRDQAIADKLAADNPNDADAAQKAKDAGQTLNQMELHEFQRRCDRNPTDLSLRVDLGIRLARARLFDQAITEMQKARSAPGRKQDALIWLGRCFMEKRNPRLAKKHFEEALQGLSAGDQKTFLELHYLLGRVNEELGDKTAATQHYDEVAAADYGYQDVAQRLDRLGQEGAPPS
jgi:tetratricopeptide (TPR) repeat protein